VGIGGERLDIFFMSGSQAGAFVQAARTMTERIRRLGPNPLKRVNGGAQAAVEAEDEEVVFRGRRTKE
jgi:hypothetical protein